jgi:Flp pilus assembly pilin Flp
LLGFEPWVNEWVAASTAAARPSTSVAANIAGSVRCVSSWNVIGPRQVSARRAGSRIPCDPNGHAPGSESLVRVEPLKIPANSGDRPDVHGLSQSARALRLLRGRKNGQTTAEYAVVLGMITVAIVAVFAALSGGISAAAQAVLDAV